MHFTTWRSPLLLQITNPLLQQCFEIVSESHLLDTASIYKKCYNNYSLRKKQTLHLAWIDHQNIFGQRGNQQTFQDYH